MLIDRSSSDCLRNHSSSSWIVILSCVKRTGFPETVWFVPIAAVVWSTNEPVEAART